MNAIEAREKSVISQKDFIIRQIQSAISLGYCMTSIPEDRPILDEVVIFLINNGFDVTLSRGTYISWQFAVKGKKGTLKIEVSNLNINT